MPSTENKLDFVEILKILCKHRVEFIVVGGVSGVLQGAPIATFDLDIVHRRSQDNIERLLAALLQLDAKHRAQAGRVIRPDRETLSGDGHALLMTNAGPLDVLATIGDKRAYEDLVESTINLRIDDSIVISLLHLKMLIKTKEETDRLKDRASLDILRATLNESDDKP